jgi:putative ABC transport system permease protein
VEPSIEFQGRPTVLQTGAAGLEPTRRFITYTLGGFAAGALLLAAVGLYGIVAYGVLQRTREIGVRIALGASSPSVLSLVLRDTLKLVAVGAALGGFGVWACTRFLSSLLFQTERSDAATLVIVSAVLGIVAVAASYVPAKRATKVDPIIAMRSE